MSNVLITGSNSGFGLLSALRFARGGDTVFATMRNTSKAGELKNARDAEKLSIHILQLDVIDEASVRRAIADAEAIGPVDVLVNNAGFGARGPIESVAEDEVRELFDTNVFGVLRVIRAVLPLMRERRRGTIVNLSSVAGIVGVPYGGLLSASKHAVEALTEALYWEVQPYGIRVALVEPGTFPTGYRGNIRTARGLTAESPYYGPAERFDTARLKLNPGEPQDPEEVAQAICDAVYTKQPKLRYLVGKDAALIGAVRKQLDFEGFEQAMRQTLDWHE